jgi:predicted esterase
MSQKAVFELVERLFSQYEKGDMDNVLRIADQIANEYPDMKYKTYYWKACTSSQMGRLEEALQSLQDGIKEGIWFSPRRLTSDPDLKPIQELESFSEIVRYCQEKLLEEQEKTKPELLVWEPSQQEIYLPLLLSIHWRGDNASRFSQFWDVEKVKERFLCAFPQSSQLFGYNEYCWDDWDKAKEEVSFLYNKLLRSYSVDHNRTVLAGASQGGKLALELALEGSQIPSVGFLLVVPSIREYESLVPLIEQAAKRGKRGCIVTGDQDFCYQTILALQKEFDKQGLLCKLIVKEGLGHFFPKDFHHILPECLSYILGK